MLHVHDTLADPTTDDISEPIINFRELHLSEIDAGLGVQGRESVSQEQLSAGEVDRAELRVMFEVFRKRRDAI